MQTAANPSSFLGARVLLAEDDDDVRFGLNEFLADCGFQVEPVGTGDRLAEYLENTVVVGARGSPEAIVSDVRMPGFSGVSILEGLRAAGVNTPMVLISAFEDDNLKEAAARLGATFLPKPIDLDALERCVQSAVVEHRKQLLAQARLLLAIPEWTSVSQALCVMEAQQAREVLVLREEDGQVLGCVTYDRMRTAALSAAARSADGVFGLLVPWWQLSDDAEIRRALDVLHRGGVDAVRALMLPESPSSRLRVVEVTTCQKEVLA